MAIAAENLVREPRDLSHVPRRVRALFPKPLGPGLVDRCISAMFPWGFWQYPGLARLAGWLLDLPPESARAYRRFVLPRSRALVIAGRLRAKVSELDGLIAELEAYAAALPDRATRKAVSKASVPPPVSD